MSLMKYRADRAVIHQPDGSIRWYADWVYGPTLSKIDNCPCSDGNRRTVYIQGEPDSFFSVPAAVNVGKHRAPGFITTSDEVEGGCVFHFTRQ